MIVFLTQLYYYIDIVLMMSFISTCVIEHINFSYLSLDGIEVTIGVEGHELLVLEGGGRERGEVEEFGVRGVLVW